MKPTYSDVLMFFGGLSLIWFAYTTVYRKFTVEVFRQKMFELRDSVFDYAAAGNMQFDHQAYQLLRTTMNGFLRYGHKISLFELFVLRLCARKNINSKDSFAKQWNIALHGVSSSQKKELELFRYRMNNLLILQSFAGSPLFLCTVIASVVALAIPAKLYKSIKDTCLNIIYRWLQGSLDRVESTALVYGR